MIGSDILKIKEKETMEKQIEELLKCGICLEFYRYKLSARKILFDSILFNVWETYTRFWLSLQLPFDASLPARVLYCMLENHIR